MDPKFSRKVWKKRGLIGYNPKDARHVVEEIQNEFAEQKTELLAMLSEKEENIKKLKLHVERIQKQFKPKNGQEEAIKTYLFEKMVESTKRVNEEMERYEIRRNEWNEKIEEKRMERDKIVSQLKATLQQLHETLTKLEGGVGHERKPTSVLPFRLKKKSN